MNKNIQKKIMSIVLTLAMVLSLLPAMTLTANAAVNYETNLVINGNGGDGSSTTGWENSDGINFISLNSPPKASQNGGNVFDYYPGAGGDATLIQTINISSISSDLSNNGVKAILSGQVYRDTTDAIARITLEQLDGGNNVLDTTSIANDVPNTWQSKSATIDKLNTSATQLRITLTAHVSGTGMDYVEFDGIDLQLYLYPTATTQAVSSINSTTATGNGNLTSLGAPNPTAYGVCWNTTGTPTISDNKVDNGATSATGAFTSAMTGLTAGTKYYVRAYATNKEGTSYGNEVSFTTTAVVPSSVTEKFTTEIVGASTFSEGGATFAITGGKLKITTVAAYGLDDDVFVENLANEMTTSGSIGSFQCSSNDFHVNSLYLTTLDVDKKISPTNDIIIRGKLDGAEQFTYTVPYTQINLTATDNYYTFVDLSSKSSYQIDELEFVADPYLAYYVHYLMIDDLDFTIIENATTEPTVSTQSVSSIGSTTATGNGNLIALGNPNPTAYGVCWNTTGTPTTSDIKANNGAASATGAFTASMTGLTGNTTYYARAYATNTAGTSYGSEVSFTTSAVVPTVTTANVTTYSTTSATMGGNVTANGGATVTDRGVVYSTTDNTPTIAEGATKAAIGTGTGSFSQSIGSLTPGTLYYVNTYAINTAGTNYGTATSFTTLTIPVGTYEVNRVINGDGSSTAGWTNSDGVYFTSIDSPTTPSANGGNVFDYYPGGSGSTATLVQTIDISSITSDLTNNGVKAVLKGEVCSSSTADTAVIRLEQLDAGNNVLAAATELSSNGTDAWQPKSADINYLNPSATQLKITLTAHTSGTGSNYAEFDGIELKLYLYPTATTQAVSSITSTTATGNGNLTSLGSSNPTAYGVCWNTTGTPTVSDSKVNNGAASATGAFTSAMTGLTPSTTYHVRSYATNSAGTVYGGEVTFTTAAVAPTATTSAVTGITAFGATLNGTVNANNASTTVTFEYGTTTSYGSSVTASQSPVSGTGATAVSYTLSGLTPNTSYHYRVVGINTAGTAYGADGTFATAAVAPTAPTVTTSAVTGITAFGATLNGTVNANNASTTVTFEYGTTSSYGSSVTASQSPVSGSSATAVSYAVPGLQPNTTYHYRVKGVNAEGTTNGSDQTFTTTAVVPTVTTSAATGITAVGATLNGTVNANNASTTVTFQYGTDTNYGTNVNASPSSVSGTGATAVSYALSGLSPSTTYHYRVVGVNAAGTTNGSDQIFTTYSLAPSNFPVMISTLIDGSVATAPGIVELKQGGTTISIASSVSTGLYTTLAVIGTYDLFINGVDTGKDISIINAPASATVNYFTVNFTVSNAGTASGSTISATANGTSISSGSVVLSGSAITINAAGAGASTYTYLWSGGGVSGQTTANASIASLSSLINATCAITGTTGSNGSGSSGSGSSTKDPSKSAGVTVEINGEAKVAGNAETTTTDGKTVTTTTIDDTKLDAILKAEGDKATVTIPSTAGSDVTVGVLTGQTVKNMEKKEVVLEIKTESVTYTLPASEINIDAVSQQIGEAVDLKDIKISVSISEPPVNTVKIVEDTANKNNYQLVVAPVEFEITCTSETKTINVSKFNGYVERTVAIPDGIDPSKITTGIVLNADGTFSHIPTSIIVIDGKYYAKINSLTNSTYSVIYNPIEFADGVNHWAKDSINNMGSRLVISGVGENNFEPDRDITRAEFAAIMVRALGLAPDTTKNTFSDVDASKWYSGYVGTAASYGIISGYDADTFAPNAEITREQAMAMVARAMTITDLEPTTASSNTSSPLTAYTDTSKISDYAKSAIAACLNTGVVTGKTAVTIAPKDNITRAEVAVIIERLLKKSKLI